MGPGMSRRRGSAVTRPGGPGERFARIPASVMRSEAVKTLNHAHFRVMVILAGQYYGTNNGALACTPRYVEQFGLRGRDTVYRALRALVERGLVVPTRQGIKQKNVFSLYALGWANIDCRDGQKLPRPERCDNERWLTWRPSAPPARGRNSDRRSVQRGTDRGYGEGSLGTDAAQ